MNEMLCMYGVLGADVQAQEVEEFWQGNGSVQYGHWIQRGRGCAGQRGGSEVPQTSSTAVQRITSIWLESWK